MVDSKLETIVFDGILEVPLVGLETSYFFIEPSVSEDNKLFLLNDARTYKAKD